MDDSVASIISPARLLKQQIQADFSPPLDKLFSNTRKLLKKTNKHSPPYIQ